MRLSIGFLVLICLPLAGCGLFGPDFTGLARGTYRLEQNGTEAEGRAVLECSFGKVDLSLRQDGEVIMSITSNQLVSAKSGESITPDYAHYSLKGTYSYDQGEIEIRKRKEGYLEGTFSFKMDLVPSGYFIPLGEPEATIKGGFNVKQLSSGSCMNDKKVR